MHSNKIIVYGNDIKMVRLGHPARLMESVMKYSLDSRITKDDSNKIVQDIRKEIQAALKKLKKTRKKDERRQIRSATIIIINTCLHFRD